MNGKTVMQHSICLEDDERLHVLKMVEGEERLGRVVR